MKRTDECDDVISVLALVLRIVQMTHEIQKYGDTCPSSLGRSGGSGPRSSRAPPRWRTRRARSRAPPPRAGRRERRARRRTRRGRRGARRARARARRLRAREARRQCGAARKTAEPEGEQKAVLSPHNWLLWASTASTSSSSVSSHGPARSLSAGTSLCRASAGSSELGRARGSARRSFSSTVDARNALHVEDDHFAKPMHPRPASRVSWHLCVKSEMLFALSPPVARERTTSRASMRSPRRPQQDSDEQDSDEEERNCGGEAGHGVRGFRAARGLLQPLRRKPLSLTASSRLATSTT